MVCAVLSACGASVPVGGTGAGGAAGNAGPGSQAGGDGGGAARGAADAGDEPDASGQARDAAADAPKVADAAPREATATPDAGASADASFARDASSGDALTGDLAKLNLFYLDVTGGRVLTANAQKPVARVLVKSAGEGPDGIAVDVAGGHIYWTGMGVPAANDGFVMRSDLDGTNVVTLVPAGGTFTPKQMKLDVAGGKIYWSDREGMRVMRANLDGSGIEALVTTGQTDTDRMNAANWCVGLALDLAGGYVYWSQKGPTNGHMGSLRRAHLVMPAGQTSITRTDIQVLYDGLPEPVDIELDVDAGYIYWTDRSDDTVSRGPIAIPAGATAATRTDRQILVTGVATAIGVALDLARGKAYYTSGANGALGRVNLDGTGNEPLIPMAGNLTGIALGELP
jgi:hypothetical protein